MHKSLWNDLEVILTVNGKSLGLGRWNASGISIDSRKSLKGDIFVALKGEKFDGHRFINDAFKRGAIAAIIEEFPPKINNN